MITLNGIVGLVLLIGALRYNIPRFNAEGTGTALATVAALATLTLVLPTFTTSRPGPEFSPAQLAFAAIASLIIYGVFVFTQTGRHRDFFLPVTSDGTVVAEEEHADPPTTRGALFSLALLVVALVAVVGLAKIESPGDRGRRSRRSGFPQSFVGVVIALLVLLPETLAASRAARRDRVQTGFNLAIGSAMASIGLTIPAIAVASIWLDGPLVLGLSSSQIVLLAVTFVVGHPHRGPRPGHPPGGRDPPGSAGRVPVPGRQPIATAAAIRATSGGPLCPMAPPMPAPFSRPSASRSAEQQHQAAEEHEDEQVEHERPAGRDVAGHPGDDAADQAEPDEQVVEADPEGPQPNGRDVGGGNAEDALVYARTGDQECFQDEHQQVDRRRDQGEHPDDDRHRAPASLVLGSKPRR